MCYGGFGCSQGGPCQSYCANDNCGTQVACGTVGCGKQVCNNGCNNSCSTGACWFSGCASGCGGFYIFDIIIGYILKKGANLYGYY